MTLVAEPLSSCAPTDGGADFQFAPGVRQSLPGFRTRCTVVRLASAGNDLLRVPRWFTIADAWADPGSVEEALWSGHPVVAVDRTDSPELVIATGAPVVVLGASIGASHWQRDVVDAIRTASARVLVVDLSPSARSGYADIATGGADRERGRRLLSLLSGPNEA
jgi:hypothetical protein